MKKDTMKKIGAALGRTAVDMAVGFAVQNVVAIPGRQIAAKRQSEKILIANEVAAYGVSIAAMCAVDSKIKSKMSQPTITMENVVDELEDLFDDVCEQMFPDEEEKEEA